MHTGRGRVEGAHAGRRDEGGDEAEKDRGDHDPHDHAGHADGEEIAERRSKAEPPILEAHAVDQAEPEVGGKIQIVFTVGVGRYADQSENPMMPRAQRRFFVLTASSTKHSLLFWQTALMCYARGLSKACAIRRHLEKQGVDPVDAHLLSKTAQLPMRHCAVRANSFRSIMVRTVP